MKFLTFFIAFFLLVFSLQSSAQSSKSVYKQKFIEGEYLLLEKNYAMALNNFLDAYKIDSTNANINYKVGLGYLMTYQKEKATSFFAKAALDASKNYTEFEPNETSAPVICYYYLAQAYHLNYEFDDAITQFERYKSFLNSKRQSNLIKDVDRQIEMCNNGKEYVKNEEKIEITNLGDSVNSPYADYSPVISADESMLIFTSRRPESTGGDRGVDNQFYEDIYVCYKKDDGTWSSPSSIGPNINTANNEATIGLSADGQQLFIYEGDNGGDVYSSKLEGDVWSVPTPMGSDINTKYWETHACLSADGNTIYFVSDRPGGFGGRDIYRCVKLPNGQWSLASNLGPGVNTEYDEDATFIHPDGVTLFFSSKGHKSMGGFDIFYSTKNNEDGSWSEPANVGYPINTTDDDVFYVASADGKRAYYSSVKKDGLGDKDIYVITLPNKKIVDPVTLLRGFITFNGGTSIPSDVRIVATDVETGAVAQEIHPNSKTGKYIMILSPGVNGKTYSLSFEANGFQSVGQTLQIDPGTSYQEIEREVELKSVDIQGATPSRSSAADIKDVAIENKEKQSAAPPAAEAVLTAEKSKTSIENPKNNTALPKNSNLEANKNTKVELPKDVSLDSPMKAEAAFANILFDNGKYTLKKEAIAQCKKIARELKKQPKVVIEVQGHTDNKGNDKINMKLSQARAKAVADYLVKKGGIKKSRLIVKGYGKSMPLAPNTTKDGKPDHKGMKLNRRVEIKIVESKK